MKKLISILAVVLLSVSAMAQVSTATGGSVEATLAATPGLAKRAAALPAGDEVTLVAAPVVTQKLIQLWD